MRDHVEAIAWEASPEWHEVEGFGMFSKSIRCGCLSASGLKGSAHSH